MKTKKENVNSIWMRLLTTLSVLTILLMANTIVMAQEKKAADNNIYDDTPEVMPEYPGGMQAMMSFIRENVKYPEDAMEKNISGKVFVSFVVEKDGSVSEAKVVKGVCESIDNEALRVVNAMPKWTPGKMDGKNVRVSYTLPFTFKL